MYPEGHPYRLSFFILLIIALEVIALAFILLHTKKIHSETTISEKVSIPFWDLCLVTESRHTRHISLPEPIAPFQDMPGFYDHFPSSTFIQPPPHFKKINK